MAASSIIIIILIIIGLLMMWKSGYPVTGVLVMTNVAVFFIQWLEYNFSDSGSECIHELGFKAEYLVNGSRPWTIFTNLFVHGGFLHIFGNMLFLVFLGMPFENRIGRKKFLIIYFSTGILANLLDGLVTLAGHGAGSNEAQVIGIGASGAIFGIMGGFAILFPRDEIPMLLGPIFLQRVPVYIAAGAYALFEIFAVQASPADHIGHVAHVTGFVSGVFLAPLIVKMPESGMKKRDYSKLEEILVSRENKGVENAVRNLMKTDIPDIRNVWWNELLNKARCPKCESQFSETRNGLKCRQCDYKLDLRMKKSKK